VVLDIGDGVGAAIVRCPPALAGHELHLHSLDGTVAIHTGVWPRPIGGAAVVVAVFPALAEGAYVLEDPHSGAPAGTITITGGAVVEATLGAVVPR
jgi:hypothetical protein